MGPLLLVASFSGFFWLPSSAYAWDHHQYLYEAMVPWIVETSDERVQKTLVSNTIINQAMDEPDLGMDENLPDSVDPLNERPYMGGTTGTSSKGFRHMYFGGWRMHHPLTTFQIPTRTLGQAPNRVEETANSAKKKITEGDLKGGSREMARSLHYLQDLSQPFHSVQVVHWRMIPWTTLLTWPVSTAFSRFVEESTRTVSNYHLALEAYVAYRLESHENPVLNSCLIRPEAQATIKLASGMNPKDFALAIADQSVELADALGRAEIAFFPERFMKPGLDLRNPEQALDYAAYAHDPGLKEARDKMEAVVCKALANAAVSSRALIEWTLHR